MTLTVDAATTHEAGHESRKPAKLLVDLIELFTDEGDLVVDPFLGSGTTLFAAEQTGRRCVGAEINPGFCAEIIAIRKSARPCGLQSRFRTPRHTESGCPQVVRKTL